MGLGTPSCSCWGRWVVAPTLWGVGALWYCLVLVPDALLDLLVLGLLVEVALWSGNSLSLQVR